MIRPDRCRRAADEFIRAACTCTDETSMRTPEQQRHRIKTVVWSLRSARSTRGLGELCGDGGEKGAARSSEVFSGWPGQARGRCRER
jgi:hypothetical protein